MTAFKSLYWVLGMMRLTRLPNLIIIAITQYLTAIFLIQGRGLWFETLQDIGLFLIIASTTMIAGAGYIINDYYDTKIDYVNRPKRVIVGRVIDRRNVLLLHSFLNGLAILIGLWVSIPIGIFHMVSGFLLWIHSNQMKRMPLLGNFVIGILAGSSLLIVALYYQNVDRLVIAYAAFACSVNIIREIVKDLAAIKGEEKFGSQALPSIWGVRNTKRLIYVLISFSGIALTYFLIKIDNGIATTYFLILIPVFFYFILLLVRADTQKKFADLGDFANLIMLTGIISIAFF